MASAEVAQGRRSDQIGKDAHRVIGVGGCPKRGDGRRPSGQAAEFRQPGGDDAVALSWIGRETPAMTIRIAVISIDAIDTGLVAEFWAAALGWDAWPDPNGGGISLAPPGLSSESGADGFSIDIWPVPEAKSGKNRLHFDVRADGRTQAAEVTRLLGLGATRVDVGQGPDVSWVVLADPEGNEFCVLQRSVAEAESAG